jgi:hypothetical protein
MAAPQGDPMAQLRALLLALEQVQIIRYADVACLALGAWEQILAFQSEYVPSYLWARVLSIHQDGVHMDYALVRGQGHILLYSILISPLYDNHALW